MGEPVYRGDKPTRPRLKAAIIALAGALLALLAAAVFRVGAEPSIEVETDLPGIGKATRVTVRVSEPKRGVGDVLVELHQGEQSFWLGEAKHQHRPFWALWGPKQKSAMVEVVSGGDSLEELQEGAAKLRVTASRAGTWLRRLRPVIFEKEVPVLLTPPSVSVLSDLIYVAQGGSEVVVYRVGSTAEVDGVRAGERWFPGYSLPGGGDDDRFAFFAVPYDLSDETQIRLEVRDAVDNVATVRFVDRFTARPLRHSRIRLTDAFFERVVPEIVARSPEIDDRSSMLETYLAVNGELRSINGQQLRELSADSRSKFLWNGAFRQQPNTKVMDWFAARRQYLYQGEVVDQQDHLGYDLASIRRAEVIAANRGRVVLARYFGIYGNTVVLDHGFGLMTLYAHLSSFVVAPGDLVDQGQTIGRSGETGLAGGDHLHFSVLLAGEPVDPVEWFDPKWIGDRLVRKLGTSLSFDG